MYLTLNQLSNPIEVDSIVKSDGSDTTELETEVVQQETDNIAEGNAEASIEEAEQTTELVGDVADVLEGAPEANETAVELGQVVTESLALRFGQKPRRLGNESKMTSGQRKSLVVVTSRQFNKSMQAQLALSQEGLVDNVKQGFAEMLSSRDGIVEAAKEAAGKLSAGTKEGPIKGAGWLRRITDKESGLIKPTDVASYLGKYHSQITGTGIVQMLTEAATLVKEAGEAFRGTDGKPDESTLKKLSSVLVVSEKSMIKIEKNLLKLNQSQLMVREMNVEKGGAEMILACDAETGKKIAEMVSELLSDDKLKKAIQDFEAAIYGEGFKNWGKSMLQFNLANISANKTVFRELPKIIKGLKSSVKKLDSMAKKRCLAATNYLEASAK
jgi:hypothetical protein